MLFVKIMKWFLKVLSASTVVFVSPSSIKNEVENMKCLVTKIEILQKQLRSYFEFWKNAHEAFLLVRVDTGEVLDVNPAACTLYRYTREEFLMMRICNVFSKPELAKQASIDQCKTFDLQWHIKQGGSVFPIKASLSYFNDQGYDVCALIVRPICEGEIYNRVN